MTAYRNELDALAARHDALATEVAQKKRELDDAARLLAEVKHKASLPVLDNIRVASPCKADWAAMTGDERVRHCGACDKDVFNISALTRDEAQALITEKAGKLCARYYQRSDGTILLADCTIGATQKRRRRWIAAGAAALLAGGGGAAAYAMRSDARHEPAQVTMGAVVTSEEMPMMGEVAIDERVEAVQQAVDVIETGGPVDHDYAEVKGDVDFRNE